MFGRDGMTTSEWMAQSGWQTRESRIPVAVSKILDSTIRQQTLSNEPSWLGDKEWEKMKKRFSAGSGFENAPLHRLARLFIQERMFLTHPSSDVGLKSGLGLDDDAEKKKKRSKKSITFICSISYLPDSWARERVREWDEQLHIFRELA